MISHRGVGALAGYLESEVVDKELVLNRETAPVVLRSPRMREVTLRNGAFHVSDDETRLLSGFLNLALSPGFDQHLEALLHPEEGGFNWEALMSAWPVLPEYLDTPENEGARAMKEPWALYTDSLDRFDRILVEGDEIRALVRRARALSGR
jgi:hypothetical protein